MLVKMKTCLNSLALLSICLLPILSFKANSSVAYVYRFLPSGKTNANGEPCFNGQIGGFDALKGFDPGFSGPNDDNVITNTVCGNSYKAVVGKPVTNLFIFRLYPKKDTKGIKRSSKIYSLGELVPQGVILYSAKFPINSIPKVNLESAEYYDAEGNKTTAINEANNGGFAVFLIKSDAVVSKDIKVNFSFSGTASKNKDYRIFSYDANNKLADITQSKTFLIPVGYSDNILAIFPNDDTDPEVPELVKLTLKANNNYKLVKNKTSSITINDND